MTKSSLAKSLIAAGAALVLLTSAAFAGSGAETTDEVSLRLGAGTNYNTTTQIVAKGTAVSVERCQRNWCLIEAGAQRGWVSMFDLNFGETASNETGGKLVLRGEGQMCFHTGANFTGDKICSKTGTVVPDLALAGYDNVFASISIEGEISANVCRDHDFGSYCEQINQDQPNLSRLLSRAISSYRIW